MKSNIIKKIFILISALFIISSCKDDEFLQKYAAEDMQDTLWITFDDFEHQPEKYLGKYVKIVGMCTSVGKRSGSLMYIIDKDPNYEIKITASEDVIKFSRYFEGRKMEILGFVRNESIWEQYEVFTKNETKFNAQEGDLDKSNDQPSTQKNRGHLKSYYYIECNRYTRIDSNPI